VVAPLLASALAGCVPRRPRQVDHGVRLTLRASKTVVDAGEPADLVLEFRNVSGRELRLPACDPWDGIWTEPDRWVPTPGSRTVQRDGKLVPVPHVEYILKGGKWDSEFTLHVAPRPARGPLVFYDRFEPREPVASGPGEVYSLTFRASEAHGGGPLDPATYRIYAEYKGYSDDSMTPVWWLVSNTVVLRVRPGAAGGREAQGEARRPPGHR